MTVRRLALAVWLTVVWCLLWADAHPGTIAAGAAVALAVVALVRPGAPSSGHVVRPLNALRFLGWFVGALVVSTWAVAREAVTPGSTIREGIVAVPIHGATPLLTTMVANAITLTPGTLTLEAVPAAEGRPGLLHVHALHLGTAEELIADVAHIEALAVRAFGPASALAQLDEPLPTRIGAP